MFQVRHERVWGLGLGEDPSNIAVGLGEGGKEVVEQGEMVEEEGIVGDVLLVVKN